MEDDKLNKVATPNFELDPNVDIVEQLRALADQIETREDKPYCFGICFLWIDKETWHTEGFLPEDNRACSLVLSYFKGIYDRYFNQKPETPDRPGH